MNRGLYIAALGMTTQMKKMDVVSNNIANVNTAGFKKDNVVTRSFDEELILKINDEKREQFNNRLGTMNMGLTIDNIYTDFSTGTLQMTENPFDFAIESEGFFKILVKDRYGNENIRYTRDGSFTISKENILITKEGHKVLGKEGEIEILGNASISVSTGGAIYSNNEQIGTLDITAFEDNAYLQKEGNNLYKALEGNEIKETGVRVLQGYKENGNVNSVKEMVEMITLSRVYEANQKMVKTYDELMSKAATEVGKK